MRSGAAGSCHGAGQRRPEDRNGVEHGDPRVQGEGPEPCAEAPLLLCQPQEDFPSPAGRAQGSPSRGEGWRFLRSFRKH